MLLWEAVALIHCCLAFHSHHSSFIHTPIDGYLGYFHVFIGVEYYNEHPSRFTLLEELLLQCFHHQSNRVQCL